MILFSVIVALLIGFIPNAKPTTILHPASFGGDPQSATDELSWRGCFWSIVKTEKLTFKPKRLRNFFRKINMNGPIQPHVKELGKCWIWKGAKISGYGTFKCGFRSQKAHRISWLILRAVIPNGMDVLHKCDNPACVNPNHLFLGTDLDNARDRVSKGRQYDLKGHKHPLTKLTEADVLKIRELATKGFGNTRLGKRFGVCGSAIGHIVHRKNWKHI